MLTWQQLINQIGVCFHLDPNYFCRCASVCHFVSFYLHNSKRLHCLPITDTIGLQRACLWMSKFVRLLECPLVNPRDSLHNHFRKNFDWCILLISIAFFTRRSPISENYKKQSKFQNFEPKIRFLRTKITRNRSLKRVCGGWKGRVTR